MEYTSVTNLLIHREHMNGSIHIICLSSCNISTLQLKNSSAGWDHFPAIVAKRCINGYITPLTHVINLSLIQGVFPSELKLARVVPII